MSRSHSAVVQGAFRRFLPWLCLLLGVCLLRPEQAWAMLWQWLPGADAGRLILVLDSPGQARSVTRTGAADLELLLNSPTHSLRQAGVAPEPGALLQALALDNGRLRIRLSPRVVNYVLTRPAPDRVAMEFFAAPAAGDPTNTSAQAAAPVAAPVDTRARLSAGLANAGNTVILPVGQIPSDLLRRQLSGLRVLPYSRLADLDVPTPLASPVAVEQRSIPDFSPSGAESGGFWSAPAYAAEVPENNGPKELGDRGMMLSRQDLLGKVNTGGPEDWPEAGGLSTATLPEPGKSASASAGNNENRLRIRRK